MAEINCPMCGKSNPAELDACQFCEARLKPLTDELRRSQPPIHPGEEPKEVDTAQLEPTLPQWLRDIRQQARDSANEEAEQPPAEEETGQQEEKADLLAGLRSPPESDEEVPDWLTGLRSEGGQVGFEETATDEDDLAALKSMLGEDAPVSQESEASALPGWVSDLGSEETRQAERSELTSFPAEGATEEPAQSEMQPPASSPDFSWKADFETDSALGAESTEDETPFDTELPAWLQDTDQAPIDESESGLPAWLQDKGESPKDETDTGRPAWLDIEKPTPFSEGEVTTPSDEGDLPGWLASLGEEGTGETAPAQDTEQPTTKSTTDWLASLNEESAEAAPHQDPESAIKSTTGWLASLKEGTTATASQQEAEQPVMEGETPDWLSAAGEENTEERLFPQEPEESAATGDLPGWLATLGEESGETAPQEDSQPSGESETPAWLSSLGAQSAAEKEEEFPTGAEFVEPSQADAEGEIPGWLAAMSEATAESEQPADELDSSTFGSDIPAEEPGAAPVFVDDEGKPISTEDVDAIFSMDMPDWLSDARGAAEEDIAPVVAEAEEDELRLAELPSWVQAMRPVESVISETEGVPPEEQPIEERGPLAGLRGVLPAVPGVGPSSKPKAYSIKLLASEDQQANAAMLEKMLAEEITPKAAATQKVVRTQRLPRLVITILFLSIVAVIFFSGTEINLIPTSVPLETSSVWGYVKDTLPANAPVLMVFDYEAARAGEMEATAAPLVDQMLTLKAPRLSLVSSTPVGSGLAERFMKILQTDREYDRNEKFINLGYLSGGAAGVQAFAKDPVNTKQLTTTGESTQTTPVLQGVSQLSNFAAIFLLTDDVETARIWIEQTEGDRGEARLFVISSAQSGPMIMPYVRSDQVNGIVTGLEASAPIEKTNGGRPGMARRYWDAYGFGLLTAAAMIAIGSLWSLLSGLQARRKEQGEG